MKGFKRFCPNCKKEVVLFDSKAQINRSKVRDFEGKSEFRMTCLHCKQGASYVLRQKDIKDWLAAKVWYGLINKKTAKYFMGYLHNTPLWTNEKERASRHPTATAERFKRRLECQSLEVALELFS